MELFIESKLDSQSCKVIYIFTGPFLSSSTASVRIERSTAVGFSLHPKCVQVATSHLILIILSRSKKTDLNNTTRTWLKSERNILGYFSILIVKNLSWKHYFDHVTIHTYIYTYTHDFILSRIYRVAKKLISSRN